MDTDLLSTLILITEPLGKITFRSIAPDSMSGGVSSVTGICKDIVCLKNQNIKHIRSVLCFELGSTCASDTHTPWAKNLYEEEMNYTC